MTSSPSPPPSPPPPTSTSAHHLPPFPPLKAPSARIQTVDVNMIETPAHSQPQSRRRIQLELSECVETRTVTTTTRLTRKFPDVFFQDPIPLSQLDAKEYPLATKPFPPELAKFSLKYSMKNDNQFHFDKRDDDIKAEAQDDEEPDLYSADTPASRPSNHYTQSPAEKPPSKSKAPLDSSRHAGRRRAPSINEPHSRRTRQSRVSLAESSYSVPQDPRPSSTRKSRPSGAPSVPDKLRKSLAQSQHGSSRRQAVQESHDDADSGFFVTPGNSAVHSQTRPSRVETLQLNIGREPKEATPITTQPRYDVASPTESENNAIFSSTVATPPITDADAEPFADADESLQRSIRNHQRPTIDIVAAQDASLPSPRLSPTLAAASLSAGSNGDPVQEEGGNLLAPSQPNWSISQSVGDANFPTELAPVGHEPNAYRLPVGLEPNFLPNARTLLETFDSMRPQMRALMMYKFLQRCSKSTLRIIADAVGPALQCDFLERLPLELSYHVLSYLDVTDLCRAAQVSKHWRHLVDRNETGWKELLDVDGFTLPPGEVIKAITQGWGWQDPVGPTGCERDLSMQRRLVSSEQDLGTSVRNEPSARRSSKRKRIAGYSGAERFKRRATSKEAIAKRDKGEAESKQHRSEGPLSAASAALAAVPDPQLGLSSLRQLHLFKSLYRRHYMIRQNWTSGRVQPRHVAFAAHPRHVITCLQFDEDKIITGSDDTFIHIYDTKTGQLRKKLEGHEGGVWALQYEGNILVSGSTDRSVRVWDIQRGLCQQVFYGHTSTVRCLHILMPTEIGRTYDDRPIMKPDKPLIITGSRDSQLRVWRLPQVGSRRYTQNSPSDRDDDCPYFIRTLFGHAHSVRAIAAHGDTLVSGSYDSTVRVWRISSGESLHVLRGHAQKVYSVVLDNERNRCISGSMDSLVKIWDLDTGACLYTLEGHTMLVGLLNLRDERLVSAAADSTLRIWDPENGRCRHTLMAHTGAITCFQHDGRKVISGSEKTVKMWDVRTGEWIQDLLTGLRGVWQVKFDQRRCVAAVQRDDLTYVEILDFGAVRDGYAPQELGNRTLLNDGEVQAMMGQEA